MTTVTRSKSCHFFMNVVAAVPTAAAARPMRTAPGSARIAQRREDEAEQQHDDEERRRRRARRAKSAQATSPAATSGGPSGVERIGVVRLRVAQLEEEVERGLVEGPVHRRGRHQARRDEGRVRDVADVPDERAQAEADAEQVEHRLEEPRHDDRSSHAGRRAGCARASRCARLPAIARAGRTRAARLTTTPPASG